MDLSAVCQNCPRKESREALWNQEMISRCSTGTFAAILLSASRYESGCQLSKQMYSEAHHLQLPNCPFTPCSWQSVEAPRLLVLKNRKTTSFVAMAQAPLLYFQFVPFESPNKSSAKYLVEVNRAQTTSGLCVRAFEPPNQTFVFSIYNHQASYEMEFT